MIISNACSQSINLETIGLFSLLFIDQPDELLVLMYLVTVIETANIVVY
mgnify:CR=1 FL=1